MTTKEKVTMSPTAPPVQSKDEAMLAKLRSTARPPEALAPHPAPQAPAARKNAVAPRLTTVEAVLAGMEPPPLPGKSKKTALQRLAVDIPADLHAKIKAHASRPNATVREDITALLAWFYNRE